MSIRILPTEVQQSIAAGEVVERPASVLKELMENALDAGAEDVRVEIKEAGRRLIQVTDDGCGITAAEVPLAFERFATSKITNVHDLETVRSFGFRGEALASIASVSRLRLLTRERDTLMGTEARLEGGRMLSLQEAGAPLGSRIEVWDLFHNTPARKKFLRSLRTEYGHILGAFTRFALAFPEKQLSLVMDGREVHAFTAATPEQRIIDIFGQHVASHLESFEEIGAWGRLWGFVISSDAAWQRRTYFFVNRRAVRNMTLYRALRDGLQDSGGIAVLFLELHPSQVDVNSHPAKSEIRFREEPEIYERVRHGLKRRTRAFGPSTPGAGEEEADYGEQAGFTLLGQIEDSFLLTLSDGHLYFLDQHAAEERVLYERLQQGKVGSRELIAPQVVNLSPEEQAFVQEHNEALNACGFVMDPFGPQVLALRAIPDFLRPKTSGLLFSRLLTRVRSQQEDFIQALSCLGAVKAGEALTPETQQRLLNAWLCTTNPHACAHDRPVYFRVSLDEVRRKVGRTCPSCASERREKAKE